VIPEKRGKGFDPYIENGPLVSFLSKVNYLFSSLPIRNKRSGRVYVKMLILVNPGV
jgi:hypothetical protein